MVVQAHANTTIHPAAKWKTRLGRAGVWVDEWV